MVSIKKFPLHSILVKIATTKNEEKKVKKKNKNWADYIWFTYSLMYFVLKSFLICVHNNSPDYF